MKMLWLIYPFCSIFILIGAGLSYTTLRGILKANAITKWPTVNATICECDLETSSGSEGGESYEVTVRYEYMVHGKKHENDKIHPAYSGSSFSGHQPLFQRLKGSNVVAARYNPVDPAESYLLAGSFSAHLAAFFGGLLFLSCGVFFLLIFHFAIAGNSDYALALEVIK